MHIIARSLTSIVLSVVLQCSSAHSAQPAAAMLTVSFEDCLEQALQNNHQRPASRYAVVIAEAQHRQALASYWPQLSASGGYELLDEDPNFLFPSSRVVLPQGGTIDLTIPNLGTVPVSAVDVPAQDVKLMDRESWRVSLESTWLLYDGGMRKGYTEQTQGVTDMMKQEVRRTDLQIVDTVKRYYFGAVLARQLHETGTETLERLETTLLLTETMYKEGSGLVKKTDWLGNKVMVESLRAMVAELEKNELLAQAALANTMGLPWQTSVTPADSNLPFTPFAEHLDDVVSSSYQFSPDWAGIEAAIHAAEGGVTSATSDHFPKLAVTGELYKWWNDYEGGMATDRNKEGWNLGIGIKIPLFSGFATKHKVAAAKARVAQLKEQQLLLKEGIGLQLKDAFLSLLAAEKTFHASQTAMEAATENRDLNTRAYQHELVETEKVIQAQLLEALMSAQHYKARYDHLALRSKINTIVGTAWQKQFAGDR